MGGPRSPAMSKVRGRGRADGSIYEPLPELRQRLFKQFREISQRGVHPLAVIFLADASGHILRGKAHLGAAVHFGDVDFENLSQRGAAFIHAGPDTPPSVPKPATGGANVAEMAAMSANSRIAAGGNVANDMGHSQLSQVGQSATAGVVNAFANAERFIQASAVFGLHTSADLAADNDLTARESISHRWDLVRSSIA
jgi:type IV secretory pathway VirJ component